MRMTYTKTGLKAVGNLLKRRRQVASEGKGAKVLNEKGFWEGGVIPNMCNDETSLARFQL